MARYFNGSSGHLRGTTSPVSGVPLTIAGWVNLSSLAAEQIVAGVWYPAVAWNGHYIRVLTSGAVQAETAENNTFAVAQTSVSLGVGAWHHVAGVWASATDRKIYLDGAAVGSNTTNKTPAAALTHILFGAAEATANTWSNWTDGSLAEFAVWNVALSAEEVASLASSISATQVRPEGLQAYWPLFSQNTAESTVGGLASAIPIHAFVPDEALPGIIVVEDAWVGGPSLAVNDAVWSQHPAIIRPRRTVFLVSSGSDAVAQSATLSVVGQCPRFELGLVGTTVTLTLTGQQGSVFSLANTSAVLALTPQQGRLGVYIAGAQSSATLAAQASTLHVQLAGTPRTATLVGQNSLLTATGTLGGETIPLTLSPRSAALGLGVAGAPASIVFARQNASFSHTFTGQVKFLGLAGQHGAFPNQFAGDPATAVVTGQSAALHRFLAGTVRTASVTGQDAGFSTGNLTYGQHATLGLNPQVARISLVAVSSGATATVVGQDALLYVPPGYNLVAETGYLLFVGQSPLISVIVPSAEIILTSLLRGHGDVSAIIGNRVYPDYLSEEVPLPAIVYERTDTDNITTIHSGEVLASQIEFDIRCLALSRRSALSLADAVEQALATGPFYPKNRRVDFYPDVDTHASIITCSVWQ